MTELTVDPGVLKPVSLYRHPIESLTVIGRFGMNPIINPFLDLNFDQLQELNLTRIAPDLVEGFMDLATMSRSKEIHLSLRRGRLTMSLLTHPFMQRITHLLISIDSHQLPSEFQYPMGVNISLPNVKSCIILYNSNLFEILDLEGVQDLGFIGLRTLQGGPNDRPLITRHPPEHVDRLKLKDCAINFSSEPEDIPHLLPHLTELELEDVALLGPLHQHLNFPGIKSLSLYDVYYSQINNADRTMPIIDELFFRTTPELEALYVRGTIMGNSLVRSLPDCTSMKILWFSNCSIDDFLILFLKRIQDKDFFPSLEVLSLVDSWAPEERIDYTGFVEHCNSKRPSLAVMGDGSPYRQP
ncbi:hypothetical protein CPB86DRAFT_626055 [Serendipita vermifera]|nr:hypothetical protein CPB86DRAFT_626055 [Serendipita vermifera]